MKKDWINSLELIKAEPNIHKIYSIAEGWCYLTDRTGTRHYISWLMTIERIKEIIERVMAINTKSQCRNTSS